MPARGSRLERMLKRLHTQKLCLDFAAAELQGLDGVILEIGLGKGRTYDHLRTLFPRREIYVFDREVHAPRACVPPTRYLRLGEFRQTLAAPALPPSPVLLVHADIGSEDADRDRALVRDIAPLIDALVAPGALIIGDRAMSVPRWYDLPLPPDAGDWPYFIYRVG